MSVIQRHIVEDIAELLGTSSEHVERQALEALVLDLYRRRDISAGRAAAFLNLDKFAFIRWAGERGVPYIRYDSRGVAAGVGRNREDVTAGVVVYDASPLIVFWQIGSLEILSELFLRAAVPGRLDNVVV
jgi:hypothetical protein